MKNKIKQKYFLLLISLSIALIDQFTKNFVHNNIEVVNYKTIIPGIINLKYIINTGAAFSLFSGHINLLSFISVSVSIILFLWLILSPPKEKLNSLGIAFLLGGTFGNGIDRLRLGYVIDFIQFQPFHFPIFNVADIAINTSLAIFILEFLLTYKRSKLL